MPVYETVVVEEQASGLSDELIQKVRKNLNVAKEAKTQRLERLYAGNSLESLVNYFFASCLLDRFMEHEIFCAWKMLIHGQLPLNDTNYLAYSQSSFPSFAMVLILRQEEWLESAYESGSTYEFKAHSDKITDAG